MYQGSLAAASNKADWVVDVELTDPTDDSLVDLTGATIELYVTHTNSPTEALVTATTGNGCIAVTGTGAFTITVPASVMADLCEGEHLVFIRATIGGVVNQIMAGTLPVIEGGPQ